MGHLLGVGVSEDHGSGLFAAGIKACVHRTSPHRLVWYGVIGGGVWYVMVGAAVGTARDE
jgi:hypothetical protein